MSHFQAVYFRNTDGRQPVHEFIRALDPEVRAAINDQVDRLNLLNDRVPHLQLPHRTPSARVGDT